MTTRRNLVRPTRSAQQSWALAAKVAYHGSTDKETGILYSMRASVKARARRVVDRIALPYVHELRSAIVGSAIDGCGHSQSPTGVEELPAATSDYFHLANHELRTLELELLPKGARRVLSVGANGRRYFDWFETAVGPVDEHLGVEAYEPMPDDLPSYVTWIPDTADHMSRVSDGTVDLVFAGQTTEHLWSYELAGFLEEGFRVLRPNGLLVLDSPNRLITEHLLRSHGGHTVELSPGEIVELVTLAGCDVMDLHGLWGSKLDGRVLQLEELIDDPAVFVRKSASGRHDPDDSFAWWLNASKVRANARCRRPSPTDPGIIRTTLADACQSRAVPDTRCRLSARSSGRRRLHWLYTALPIEGWADHGFHHACRRHLGIGERLPSRLGHARRLANSPSHRRRCTFRRRHHLMAVRSAGTRLHRDRPVLCGACELRCVHPAPLPVGL